MQLAVLFTAQSLFGGLLKIGMLAAGMAISLLANQKIDQPIQDLKVSTSSYGRGIPRVYGAFRTTGNMFWSTDLVLVKKYIGPKGKQYSSAKGPKKQKSGKAQEVNTYYASFAMGLCVGPMAGVLRVWCDSNLIYDKYNPLGYYNVDGVWVPVVQTGFSQRPPVTGPGVTNMTKADEKNQKKAPSPQPFDFKFYGGTEDQLQDPTMIVASGAENTPAYRGLVYLMFTNFPLQDFGNRIPTITAEVTPQLNRAIRVIYWAPMDSPPFPVQDGIFGEAAVDPSVGFLYQPSLVDDGGPTTWCVRVFDIYQQTETYRWKCPLGSSMIGANGSGGVACAGVMRGDATAPVYMCNAIDGSVLYTVDSLAPYRSSPLLTVDSTGNTINDTMITSIFGDTTIVESGLDCGSAGIGSLASQGAPGTPQNVLISNKQTTVILASGPYAQSGVFINVTNRGSLLPGPSAPPIFSMAADAYLITYQDSAGKTYAAAYSTNGVPLWEKQIDTVPIPPGPQIPIIQGNTYRYLWSSGSGSILISINIKTGDWSQETLPIWNTPGGAPLLAFAKPGTQFFDEGGDAIVYYSDTNTHAGPGWYKIYFDNFLQAEVPLSGVLIDVMGQVGVDASEIDSTDLSLDFLNGFSIENVTSARKVIEDLARIFLFDVTESDGLLKVVSRGKTPVMTIFQDSLGIVGQEENDGKQSNGSPSHFYEETRIQEIDLPARVDISYVDPIREYEAGTTGYARPSSPNPVMQSRNLMQVSLAISLTETAAQQWAETICNAAWTERVNHKLVLPSNFILLDPTDVVFVSMADGLTFLDRITRVNLGGNYALQIESVSQSEPYYLAPGVAPTVEDLYSPYSPVSAGFNPGGVVPVAPPPARIVIPLLMDTPLTQDGDAGKSGGNIPLNWGVGAYGPGFTGGGLQLLPSGGTWSPEGGTSFESVWGYVATATPPPRKGAWATDRFTKIILAQRYDYEQFGVYEWQTIDDLEWPSYKNMILIGREIICFKTATVNADKTVTISTLLRGQRGTENECGAHAINEKFVMLNTSGDQLAALPKTDLNISVAGKIATGQLVQAISPSQTIIFKGNALRPFAPTAIKRLDAGGDSIITWVRRTRYNGPLQDAVSAVPLNEDSEIYRVYISLTPIDATTFDPTVAAMFKREVDNLTSSTFTYTVDMKAADGFNSMTLIDADLTLDGVPIILGTVVDPFWVAIYQISGEANLGFPGVAVLETSAPPYR